MKQSVVQRALVAAGFCAVVVGLTGSLTACVPLVVGGAAAGTALVATVGVFGAVVAGFMADHVSDIGRVVGGFFGTSVEGWRMSYFIGGGLGLLLLLLRVGVHESGMFHHAKSVESPGSVSRGNFFALFTSRDRFAR